MLRGILLFALGLAVVAGGLAAYMVWGQGGANPTTAPNADARSQFFADRGGTVPMTGTTGSGVPAGPGGSFPGLAGTVDSVAGDTIKVKSAQDGSTTTVHLAADARIGKQVSGQASDITVGAQLSAIGAQN